MADTGEPIGVQNLMQLIHEEFPELKFGYFNPPMERIQGRYEIGLCPLKPISDPIVLHETPNWIAIGKPAGLVIEKSPYEPSLESWVMHYLSLHHKSPFVGVIHRLDRMTTGIILFAKKKQALKKFNVIL